MWRREEALKDLENRTKDLGGSAATYEFYVGRFQQGKQAQPRGVDGPAAKLVLEAFQGPQYLANLLAGFVSDFYQRVSVSESGVLRYQIPRVRGRPRDPARRRGCEAVSWFVAEQRGINGAHR